LVVWVNFGLEKNCAVLGCYAASGATRCANNPQERSSQLPHGGSLKSRSLDLTSVLLP